MSDKEATVETAADKKATVETAVAVRLVPSSAGISLTTDPGPYNKELSEKVQRETQLVSGMMFIDKIEKEKVKKEQTPVYEKATKQMELLLKKINSKAVKLVNDMKDDEIFTSVKIAMSALGIEVRCGVNFCKVDMDERNSNTIVYTRSVTRRGQDRYDYTWSTDERELGFNEELKELQAKYWEQYDIAEEAKDKIIAAETALRDRANRMADAQGLVALNNMTDADRALALRMHQQRDVKDITKLLGTAKKA